MIINNYVKLRSIPLANRLPRGSSMQASINSGFRMVGSQEHRSEPTVSESNFKPKVILPDLKIQEQRNEYYKSVKLFISRINDLIAAATEPDELKFWEDRLNNIKGI